MRDVRIDLSIAVLTSDLPALVGTSDCPAMPVVFETRHPKGMTFAQEKRVVVLREVRKLPFHKIKDMVFNLEKKRPSLQHVI